MKIDSLHTAHTVVNTLNQTKRTVEDVSRLSANPWLRLSVFNRFLVSTSAMLLLLSGAGAFFVNQARQWWQPEPVAITTPMVVVTSTLAATQVATPAIQPIVVTSVPSVSSATEITNTRPYTEYVVQSGDTMGQIAITTGQPFVAVCKSNEDTNPKPGLILTGETLLIPLKPGIVVRANVSDTVETLAQRKHLLTDMLIAEGSNGLTRSDQAFTQEQVLFVPVPLETVQCPGGAGGGVFDQTNHVATAAPPPDAATDMPFAFPTQAHWLSGYDFAPTHPGLDFYGTLGTPVVAAASGTVSFVGVDTDAAGQVQGYGLNVVLTHDVGFSSQYAHLSQALVAPGDVVQAGQVIGLIGDSGNTNGPHLHFELRYVGVAVNPWGYLR